MRHVMEIFNPNENLLERIFSRENMQSAWKRVKANKGAAGIDQMTVADFPAFAQENWDKIRESLLNGTYETKPVRRVEIPKGNTGKTRPLGIPTVQDRLIQQAIAQILTQDFLGLVMGLGWENRLIRRFINFESIFEKVVELR